MSTAEQWRPVRGFENYHASSLGRVVDEDGEPVAHRAYRGRLSVYLKPSEASRGRTVLLHRVVLLSFFGYPPPGCESCHFPLRDTDVCRLDNLRWDTQAENALDAAAHRDGDRTLIEARLRSLLRRFPHLRSSTDGLSFTPSDYVRRNNEIDAMLARIRAKRLAGVSP